MKIINNTINKKFKCKSTLPVSLYQHPSNRGSIKLHSTNTPATEEASNTAKSASFPANSKQVIYLDDNPDTVKPFTKPDQPLTLEFIKGCLLGTAKTLLLKCLSLFCADFPDVERYCVSASWQSEFKFECNLLLATVADQSQLGYLALQTLVEGMRELSEPEPTPKCAQPSRFKQGKKSKLTKKGLYQMFDVTSRAHLNQR